MFARFRKVPPGSIAAVADIEACSQQLKKSVQTRLATLSKAMATAPDDILEEVAQTFAYAHHAADAICRLKQSLAKQPDNSPKNDQHFLVSSIFLREVFTYLTSDPQKRERMILVTGPVTNTGTVVLSSMHTVKTSQQSAAYVQADPAATAQQLDELVSNAQHQLWGMFHSHILHGKNSTQPSQIDIDHQNRLVEFGMPDTLGGIFSLDGWVRIFSTAQSFSLTTYGGGVDVIEDHPREKILKLAAPEVDDVLAQN